MKDLRWPHVALIAVVLGVLGGLAYAGKDSAALVGGVIALLGAMGMIVKGQAEVKEQATAIKEQTNGNTSALLTTVTDLQRHLIEQQRVHQEQMIEQQKMHQEQLLSLAERLAGMQPLPPAANSAAINGVSHSEEKNHA